MKDGLITCPRCTSDACYHIEDNDHHNWFCYGCGFISDSTKTLNSETLEQFEETLPELYKALAYYDSESKTKFFPTAINMPTKGMIFADGTGAKDWKWAAVLAVEIPKEEKSRFPKGQTHKMDMKTIQHYDERDFMEALDHIGYFSQA
jgi:hypothetical protein